MLRCLGVKVKHVALICGDNKDVIQNCTILDSLLKKNMLRLPITIIEKLLMLVYSIKSKSTQNAISLIC